MDGLPVVRHSPRRDASSTQQLGTRAAQVPQVPPQARAKRQQSLQTSTPWQVQRVQLPMHRHRQWHPHQAHAEGVARAWQPAVVQLWRPHPREPDVELLPAVRAPPVQHLGHRVARNWEVQDIMTQKVCARLGLPVSILEVLLLPGHYSAVLYRKRA